MSKIFVFPVRPNPEGDCLYLAVAEDGEEITGHISSNEGWGQWDMGVVDGSTSKHEEYRKKYPGGYELEYVSDWKAHSFLSKQADANKGGEVK